MDESGTLLCDWDEHELQRATQSALLHADYDDDSDGNDGYLNDRRRLSGGRGLVSSDAGMAALRSSRTAAARTNALSAAHRRVVQLCAALGSDTFLVDTVVRAAVQLEHLSAREDAAQGGKAAPRCGARRKGTQKKRGAARQRSVGYEAPNKQRVEENVHAALKNA